jgi:dipeptidyl aminopeptidase/acylaminoacyl peptidase
MLRKEADDVDLLESLAELPGCYHQTVSPDGRRVAYYYDGSGRNELHVQEMETGGREQWSDGNVPRDARWHLKWAGNDEVLFHVDEDGNEQNDIHALDASGAAEPVVEMDGQVVLHDVTDGGGRLVVGSTRDGQLNLYRHDRAGGETTKLTTYDRAVNVAHLAPDGDRIAFSTNETSVFENVDTYLMDADGSNVERLGCSETGAETQPVAFSPSGDRLLLADNADDRGRVGVYDLAAGEVTWYGGDVVEQPHAFLPDGDRVLLDRRREMAVVAATLDLETGEVREFDLPTGVTDVTGAFPAGQGNPVVDDGQVVCAHGTPDGRSDLLTYDLETGASETLLAADYGAFESDAFVDSEVISFESDGVPETPARAVETGPYDSLEIEAQLYDTGERPAPLAVKVHGGPRYADYRNFNVYTQFLASQGYAVLEVNYRGSAGRGREFVRELYDDWGGAEQGDVATGVEHVLATRDWLDEDRVAVFGGSYGGYSAYWQAVQYPDLYDATVAWIGLTDLREMYETTMPHFRTELMEKNIGTPGENPDLYRDRSPIEHAGNVDAPLLLIHGVNDRRVPVSQARLFRDRLRELGYEVEERPPGGEAGGGADAEYVELGEEGHASTDSDQKLRTFRVLADFLDRRL